MKFHTHISIITLISWTISRLSLTFLLFSACFVFDVLIFICVEKVYFANHKDVMFRINQFVHILTQILKHDESSEHTHVNNVIAVIDEFCFVLEWEKYIWFDIWNVLSFETIQTVNQKTQFDRSTDHSISGWCVRKANKISNKIIYVGKSRVFVENVVQPIFILHEKFHTTAIN